MASNSSSVRLGILPQTSPPQRLVRKYIKHHYNVLNLIFGYAERQDIIPKNPMKKVDTPKVSKNVDALTEEEAVRFFDALLACDFKSRCILQVLITTGLRQGE